MKKFLIVAVATVLTMTACTKVVEHPKAPKSEYSTVAPPEEPAEDAPGPAKFKNNPNQ